MGVRNIIRRKSLMAARRSNLIPTENGHLELAAYIFQYIFSTDKMNIISEQMIQDCRSYSETNATFCQYAWKNMCSIHQFRVAKKLGKTSDANRISHIPGLFICSPSWVLLHLQQLKPPSPLRSPFRIYSWSFSWTICILLVNKLQSIKRFSLRSDRTDDESGNNKWATSSLLLPHIIYIYIYMLYYEEISFHSHEMKRKEKTRLIHRFRNILPNLSLYVRNTNT